MKNFILILFVFVSLQLTAQTDGISYQAVIIGPDNQELPGVDAEGNILPDATVAIRFTILDESNQVEYQEVQTTNTDQYGRINLIIGEMDPDGFAEISWDGTNKDLKVEIDFEGGTSYVDMAREKLTFLPYAFHRNITASGTLTVDDLTFLNGELQVEGPANLNSTLNVNGGNATNLSGDLTVEGNTNLNNDLLIIGDLEVVGATVLNDSLNVVGQATTNLSGDVNIGGNLNVEGNSDFDALTGNTLLINNETTLAGPTTIGDVTTVNAQFTINANMDSNGDELEYSAYPLLVQGSSQGIAIKVNGIDNDNPTVLPDVPISSGNNFISFWNAEENNMWGRIEGESIADKFDNTDFILEEAVRIKDLGLAIYEALKAGWELIQSFIDLFGSSTASTVCAGVGACVTAPPPGPIVAALTDLVSKIVSLVKSGIAVNDALNSLETYTEYKDQNVGVSYLSSAGDYAEWLPKEDRQMRFIPGEIIGVKNGKVSKKLWDADKIMIVSTRPIVLGNMPQGLEEKDYVKVAFMGQVPVKVLGDVSPGDYILPNFLGSSYAKAISPDDMNTRDYKNIAGVVWSITSEITDNLKLVNVAVGINTNDLTDIVAKQEEELKKIKQSTDELRSQLDKTNEILADLVPGYGDSFGIANKEIEVQNIKEKGEDNHINKFDEILYHDESDILYFEISRNQIEMALEIGRKQYLDLLAGKEEQNMQLLGKYYQPLSGRNSVSVIIEKNEFWEMMDSEPGYKEEIINYIQTNLNKALHTHKEFAHNFTELKMRED